MPTNAAIAAQGEVDADLRRRSLRLMRLPRPTRALQGDKHTWVQEFMALYDLQAWKAHVPPLARQDWLGELGVFSPGMVRRYRVYLKVFQAAVDAGLNAWHLRRTPIKVLYDLRAHLDHPQRLVREIAGDDTAAARNRVKRNRRQRELSQGKKIGT